MLNTKPHPVTYLTGEREVILLARLSIRQLYQWAKHFAADDTPALVTLCTGKPEDWVNRLSDESFAELAKVCVEENFPRALTIMERDPVMAATLAPALVRLAAAGTAAGVRPESLAASPGPNSSNSSTEPPPSASAAETPSASSISPPSDSSASSPSIAA